MLKNRFTNIIFLLFLGIAAIYPQASRARSCTDEEMDNMIKKADEAAVKAIDTFTSIANTFNTAAKNYISSCKTPTEKPRYFPDTSISARAKVIGKDYGNENYWKYTGYNWTLEIPQSDAAHKNCASLLQNVKNAKAVFDKNVTLTEKAIHNSALGKDQALCECSDKGDNGLCRERTEDVGAKTTTACASFAQYQSELSACPLCPIFEVILRTIASVSSVSWGAVAEPLSNVVKIFFLVLLAKEVLKAVAAVAGTKLSSFAKSVLLLCTKAGITILLLSSPRYIYGYFLSPVIEGGLNMGINIANSSGAGGQCAVSAEDKISIPSDTFDDSVYESVMSTVRCFGVSASTMPAIGRGLTCNAWNDTTLGIPNLGMWFSGAIMYVVGLMIWLAISFYMIDCTVQIGMLSGLVPLLIACWPFELTKTYSYKGCKMLMNSFFSYAMLGIVLLLGTEITTYSISGDGSSINEIIRALDNNDLDSLKKFCDLSGFQILILVACAIFAMKLIGQTNTLAGQFSNGSGSDIGTKLGGLATSAATNVVKGGAKLAGRVAKGGGGYIADASGATAAVNKGLDSAKSKWQAGWAKVGQKARWGKYQNQQTGYGKEGNEESNPDDEEENQQPDEELNSNPQPTRDEDNVNPENDTQNPSEEESQNPEDREQ